MLKLWYRVFAAMIVVAAAATPALAQQSQAPPGALAYFVNLHDGDTVSSPFKVVFGLSPDMGVAPAGTELPNVGHHHLLIDTKLTPEELTQPIAVDEPHVHFGKGQTETMLTLPPGRHTLQIMLGDTSHVPFDPSVQSAVVTVNVKSADAGSTAAAAPAPTSAPPTPTGKRSRTSVQRTDPHAAMVFKAPALAH
ncbi:MAG TPA: DUF4399 domain-containing protein [Xanthobacteraceae bacterium]|nr:DUF4399 domain-containing protein [Xanthobacteraceae bacterium]